ncbi:MAG: hypothetical protein AAFV19_19565 [Pseudomonadota bacterium]
MRYMKHLVATSFFCLGLFSATSPVQAACGATINGYPMTPQQCALAIQIYGTVIPGRYGADANGNWWNLDNPRHRGNTYRDARRAQQRSSGGSWSGRHTSGVYDSSGGCEGGSCVNIID